MLSRMGFPTSSLLGVHRVFPPAHPAACLAQGDHVLTIKGMGRGTPLVDGSGFSSYGIMGQYRITITLDCE